MKNNQDLLSRLGRCVRFEWTKLSTRPMGWLSLLIIVTSTFLIAWLKAVGDDAPTSFMLLTSILKDALPIGAFVLLMLGTLSVNDEASSGALRSIAMSAVGRGEIIIAKVLVLVTFAFLAMIIQILIAYAWVQTHAPLHEVSIIIEGFEPDLKFSQAEMMEHATKLSALMVPAILSAPILGLLLSLLVAAPGTSVAVSVFVFGGMELIGTAFASTRCVLFPATIDHLLTLLGELSEGIETNVDVVVRMNALSDIFWIPLMIFTTLTLAAVALFNVKEIKC